MEELINPVEAYRWFYHGDPNDFRYGEIVVSSVANRGNYGNADKYMNHVAKKGHDESAYTSVGRWRRHEEGEHNKPVFVPYLTIDLDRELLTTAFDDAKEILNQMYQAGLRLDVVYVSYSGRRGFHIQIPSSLFGSPIFSDASAAKKLLQMFVARTVEGVEVDPSTFSPLALVRLSGSTHEQTGDRKFTVMADKFLDMTLHDLFSTTERVTEFQNIAETEEMLHDEWIKTVEHADNTHVEYKYGKRIGSKIGRIIKGIAESEVWSEYDVGRNRAAFVLGCWLYEDEGQRRQVCDHLGYKPVKQDSYGAAYETLEFWNQQMNKPPLKEHELKRTFKSAVRTINGTLN